MVLVYLKNLIFPSLKKRPSSSSLSSSPSAASSLLPTSATKNNGSSSSRPREYCPNPTCPLLSSPSLEHNCAEHFEKPTAKSVIDPRVLSDLTIGLSDGLTVPFALTAGLSAFNDTKVVLYGGLAELIAGSISMGLGGWLAGRGEAEFYKNTLDATHSMIATQPSAVPPLLCSILAPYSLPPSSLTSVVSSLTSSPALPSFIMQFHHKLPPPSDRTPLSSALTIAAGYFFGGFVPLLPYFFVNRDQVLRGLAWSVGVMTASLFAFGIGKSLLVEAGEDVGEDEGQTGGRKWGKAVRGGVEMVFVGGVAATAAMGIIKALG